MKRLVLTLILALPLAVAAQSDSAAVRIVERYLAIMNIDAMPADSMLVATTQIVYPITGDTLTMRRLYAAPHMFRVEVRDADGKLQTGLCGDGISHYRAYSTHAMQWRSITRESYFSRLGGFDLRGPLYDWRNENAYLTYRGATEYKGQRLDVVHFSAPGYFGRLYMFEPSGLLSVILEEDSVDDGYHALLDAHIDWKCVHEYAHVGPLLIPSIESFMREKTLTVLHTEAHLEKRDNDQFRQD